MPRASQDSEKSFQAFFCEKEVMAFVVGVKRQFQSRLKEEGAAADAPTSSSSTAHAKK